MAKAIIFDCFGVLVRDGWLHFKEQHFSSNQDLLTQATDLNHQTDAGLLTYNDFIKAIANLAQVNEEVARADIENNIKNSELLKFIKNELNPNFKLGILSNAAENWLEDLLGSEDLSLFNSVALSYKIGAIKPDPITYKTIAEHLGVEESECIFIDDQERYCQGAEAVGMQSIWYQNNAQFFADIKTILAANG